MKNHEYTSKVFVERARVPYSEVLVLMLAWPSPRPAD